MHGACPLPAWHTKSSGTSSSVLQGPPSGVGRKGPGSSDLKPTSPLPLTLCLVSIACSSASLMPPEAGEPLGWLTSGLRAPPSDAPPSELPPLLPLAAPSLLPPLAVLAARKQKPVHSATFLTAFLDFSHTGVMDVFIDEGMVKFREMQMGRGGLMAGRDLAHTFNFLRPNDLVWNYVVGNYLKGETPPPFDLLYWNSDSTNLPGPMYAWYLRNTYFENNLVKPGKATVCGEQIDLRKVDIPAYLYGPPAHHIVPNRGA